MTTVTASKKREREEQRRKVQEDTRRALEGQWSKLTAEQKTTVKNKMAAAVVEKVREDRLRRKAARLGYRLSRSRSRDPDAMDFGLYAIISIQTSGAVNPALAGSWVHSWDLDTVEHWLTSDDVDHPGSTQ